MLKFNWFFKFFLGPLANFRENALVFHGERGENAAVTRDLSVTAETILQFQVNLIPS